MATRKTVPEYPAYGQSMRTTPATSSGTPAYMPDSSTSANESYGHGQQHSTYPGMAPGYSNLPPGASSFSDASASNSHVRSLTGETNINPPFANGDRTRMYTGTSQATVVDYNGNGNGAYTQQQEPHTNGYGHHPTQPFDQAGLDPVANGSAYPTYEANGHVTPADGHHHHQHKPVPPASEVGKGHAWFSVSDIRNLSKKAKRRLIAVGILAILALILIILFEVYKTQFENWLTPLRDWLKARQTWSWVIPVVILVILSFPPLFGHEIVQLLAGLAYPIGVAIGIACAGAIIGEALVFVVFKYALSGRVRRKTEEKVSWAAIARVSQEAGFKGVMIIRYSIVPPHLANPIFATTGMAVWLYMISVILSLPKQIIFAILGSPTAKGKTGAKIGKVVAVGVLVLVTLYGTYWLRKRLVIATAEIEAERNADLLAKQQGLVAAGAPDPERADQPELADMSPSERREWEQQRQMDVMEMKKMNEGTRVSVQGR